jgi:outer membrane protein assembly factor BamD (BamD/ComL family)
MNFTAKFSGHWLAISAAGLAIGLTAFYGGKTLLNQYHYEQALNAYEQGDCKQALSEFDIFFQNTTAEEMDDQVGRAKQIQKECEQYNAVVQYQQAGKLDYTLATIAKFSAQYPKSSLMNRLRPMASTLFASQPIEVLAKPISCQQFNHLKTLISTANTPQFYSACGKTLSENGDYEQSITIYENFLNQFPHHKLSQSIKEAYAQTLYDEAQSKGAGNLPQPSQGGTTGDGSTQVEIRNESPEKMRIVFGGPTPRVEELEPCKNCQSYTNRPPKICPNQGPVGIYTVDPGQYRIVVKSIGDRTVTPYTGDWSLDGSTKYTNCFFIVQRPLGSPEPLPDIKFKNKS